MNEIEIKQKLDQLAEFQSERDVAMLEKQRLLDEVYSAEIKSRMAERVHQCRETSHLFNTRHCLRTPAMVSSGSGGV